MNAIEEKKEPRQLTATEPQKVSYAIPLWLRDEQIKLATARVKARITPPGKLIDEPCAIVCFGPSLNDTWEEVRKFKHIFTCSGSHKFLVERGVIPTWHVEVDPRPHKVELIGQPNPSVEYLIASTCHPKVFDHLEGMKVTLWHVFDGEADALRTLPPGEWALTGGCSVGLRVMTIARFLGFTKQHVFGMDGSKGSTGKHAAPHPNQAKYDFETVYNGVTYLTTPAFLEAARTTFHELNQMPDVKATFYGEGLVQAMAKDYKPQPVGQGKAMIGFTKPELISDKMLQLNSKLHRDVPEFGVGGGKHSETVLKMVEISKLKSVLDYGCGKGLLAKSLPFPIWEYDPCVEGKTQSPKPAELVVCTDVLEHIEPEKLAVVLDDLRRCVLKVGYFVINTGPAKKKYADGRNTHLLQKGEEWWRKRLDRFFDIGKIEVAGAELHVVVGPKTKETKPTSEVTEVQNGSVACKFYTPNDATRWRATTLLKKEPVTTQWVNSIKPGEVMFDIGANVGGYSVLAATRGVDVIAFEPEAENYALLVRNMVLNGVQPKAFCLALSDKRQIGVLRLSTAGAGSSCHSFGMKTDLGMDGLKGPQQGCYGITLDELVEAGLPAPDHVKLDVDGFEPRVVEGAAKVLSNGVKSLLVEVNTNVPEHLAMVERIRGFGFEFDQKQVDGSIRKDGNFKGVSEYLFTKVQNRVQVEERFRHLLSAFDVAPILSDPFPHCYVENVFTSEAYADLLANMPKDYVEISKSRSVKGYPLRFTAQPSSEIWRSLYRNLRDGAFKKSLCEKFGIEGWDGYEDECLLIRDHAGYQIGPHTDSPAKIITVLFYMPKDELPAAGTSLYVPKRSDFTCKGGPHYPSKDFDLVKTMPFRPNSAFAFLKTDNSFHGVEACELTRDVLLYDVRKKD